MSRFFLKIRRNFVLKLERRLRSRFGAQPLDVPLAIIIGIFAALVAGVLHWLVSQLEKINSFLHSSGNIWLIGLFFLMPFIGVVVSRIFQMYCGGSKYAKSLSPLILALNRGGSRIPFSEVFTHVISSAISVGCGGSTGLEAPSVLTGAAVGSNTADFFGIDRKRRLLLTGCGGAAAIAAIFRSPVGGILFAVEVLLPQFSVASLVPLLISSAVAMVVSREFFHHEAVLQWQNPVWQTGAIPYYFLCGAVCALAGVLVIRSAYKTAALMKKFLPENWQKMIFGGLILCLILAIFPILRGQGYNYIAQLYDGDIVSARYTSPWLSFMTVAGQMAVVITVAILAKAVTAMLTVDSGGDGGIFAPTMFVGAFVGFAFARLLNLTGLVQLQEANFVVVGICGVFSAVLRAPLTGIFLIADVTASYILLVPLMIVSSVSWFIARLFEPWSIYEKGLIESGKLLPDRDDSILRRMSVRLCLETNFTSFFPEQDMESMHDAVYGEHTEIFPVLDRQGNLLGVVHTEKLLTVLVDPVMSRSLVIFDLMDKPLGMVGEDDDLATAMRNLEQFKLESIPVSDKNGKFLGFVRRASIFKLYRSSNRDTY